MSWRVELELENGIGDLRILYGTLLFVSRFSTLSSQSNPKTHLRGVGVGERNWRFENLVRKILTLTPNYCPLTPDVEFKKKVSTYHKTGHFAGYIIFAVKKQHRRKTRFV